jgi:predicted CopG family antitoxin
VNPPLPRPSPPAPKVIHVEPEKTTKKKRSGSAMLAWLAGNKFEEEEDDDISQEEEAELAVVDFRGALDAQVAVAEMLCRFTNVKDVHSELMERLWDSSESESEDEDSDDDSHTVSDGSTC